MHAVDPTSASRHADRMATLRSLDPIEDDQEIAHLIACYEFPWDTTRALEMALLRTFCDPRIAGLLHATQEFERRALKRYDDTDILVSELLEHGYDSDRGRAAIARINSLHARFSIRNEDFLYVLSTFVLEPIHWNARAGWRPMHDVEKLGWCHFWRQVGLRMGIRDIPEDLAGFEDLRREHEARAFRYARANRCVAGATMTMFARWFPRGLRRIADAAMRSLMDTAMLDSFGLRPPAPWTRAAVATGLRIRAMALRLLPKRRRPRYRTQRRHASYPDGYSIELLGPRGAAAAQR